MGGHRPDRKYNPTGARSGISSALQQYRQTVEHIEDEIRKIKDANAALGENLLPTLRESFQEKYIENQQSGKSPW